VYNPATYLLSSTDCQGTLTATITPSVIMHAVSGTTDDTTNSASYVSTGTSITFTAVKTNLLVSFTLSGQTVQNSGNIYAQDVNVIILLDGVSQGGSSVPAVTIGDLINNTQDFSFNLAFSKLITITTGTHTLTMEWAVTPIQGVASKVACSPTGNPNQNHRTISAIEF
jgi:hypothetical protein